jgi:hypothetical protein
VTESRSRRDHEDREDESNYYCDDISRHADNLAQRT